MREVLGSLLFVAVLLNGVWFSDSGIAHACLPEDWGADAQLPMDEDAALVSADGSVIFPARGTEFRMAQLLDSQGEIHAGELRDLSADGFFAFVPTTPVAPGLYTLRLEANPEWGDFEGFVRVADQASEPAVSLDEVAIQWSARNTSDACQVIEPDTPEGCSDDCGALFELCNSSWSVGVEGAPRVAATTTSSAGAYLVGYQVDGRDWIWSMTGQVDTQSFWVPEGADEACINAAILGVDDSPVSVDSKCVSVADFPKPPDSELPEFETLKRAIEPRPDNCIGPALDAEGKPVQSEESSSSGCAALGQTRSAAVWPTLLILMGLMMRQRRRTRYV